MLAAWGPNVALKRELVLNGLVIVSNLCLEGERGRGRRRKKKSNILTHNLEAHANAVRKANGIPTIVALVTSQSDSDVKMAALHALITLSNSSGISFYIFYYFIWR